MADTIENQIEKLRQGIAALELQRGLLGEATVDTLLAPVRKELAALEALQTSEQEYPFREDRRILTILFMDIVGSTTLAEKMDPEDWREVISQVHALSGRAIQAQGGMVLQYLGDGILAIFGAQTFRESDPENAVRAAMEIHSKLGAHPFDLQIQMRAGIHTGLVVLGELGSEAKRELTATGDAMNLAARLQSAAPLGGVLISHDTFRFVSGIFEMGKQSPFTVKGKSDPIQTYQVIRARPRRFQISHRGVMGIDQPTVGRKKETETIQKAFLKAVEGRKTGWVSLVGEPGIGKSRLFGEFLDHLALRSEDFFLLKGRVFQGDEQQAYALIRHLWFDQFGIAEDAPVEKAQEEWTQACQAVGASAAEAHALGLLAGLPFEASPYVAGIRQDPNQVKGRAVVVSRKIISYLLQKTPVIVLLEDLHWIDPESWEYLLEVLIEHPEHADPGRNGLFVLSTARPEWNPPKNLTVFQEYTLVQLSPLDLDACRSLTRSYVESVEGVPDALIESIVERSEGIPYFIEEMVNWFFDQGIIDRISLPWRYMPQKQEGAALPFTLQHLLQARLSSLNSTERLTLQCGSVFGRNFWETGIEEMGVATSQTILERLQPRNFVHHQHVSSLEGNPEWSFHHNLQREVTYESLLKRERRKLHRVALSWLEKEARQAGRVDEFAGILGKHAELAGDFHSAANWFLQAGRHAMKQGAIVTARNFLDRCLEFMPEADLEGIWKALLERNEVLGILGEIDLRLEDDARLVQMAKEARNNLWLAEAYLRHGYSLAMKGDDRQAVWAYEIALTNAREEGSLKLEALTLGLMVVSQTHLGDLSGAEQTARAAITRADESGDPDAQTRNLANVSIYHIATGNLYDAYQLQLRHVNLARQLGNIESEGVGLTNLGYGYLMVGFYEKGLVALENSLKIVESVSASHITAYNGLNLGLAYWRTGEAEAALQTLNPALAVLDKIGDSFGKAAGRTYLGLVFESIDEFDIAREKFQEAMEIYLQVSMPGYAQDALAGAARCAKALGRQEEAYQYATNVRDYLEKNNAQGLEFPILAYLTCGQIFQSLGNESQARLIVESGYHKLVKSAERIGDPDWRASYLDNVPEHRELKEFREQLNPADKSSNFFTIGERDYVKTND
jgi:class 3 adenylate cyclase/predicted ATPase